MSWLKRFVADKTNRSIEIPDEDTMESDGRKIELSTSGLHDAILRKKYGKDTMESGSLPPERHWSRFTLGKNERGFVIDGIDNCAPHDNPNNVINAMQILREDVDERERPPWW